MAVPIPDLNVKFGDARSESGAQNAEGNVFGAFNYNASPSYGLYIGLTVAGLVGAFWVMRTTK